jgi:predicted nucleic acid-binding protein
VASILVDTGPLVALFDSSERAHRRVADCLAGLNPVDRLYTSLAVITEVTHLLDFSVAKQMEFLRWCELGGVSIEPMERGDLPTIHALMWKYRDLPADFADATLVLLADRLQTLEILTLDRNDFGVYRNSRGHSFMNRLDP